MRNADSSATNRDHCLRFQRMAMPLKHLGHEGSALRRRHVREAHQAHMRSVPHIDKFSEVGINRHQNSAFRGGTLE